ncbi:MAG: transcription termination/antitermination factor NusG [Bacteroidales bacterium]|jgi:transcriptional antiterminator NusG|nr:transcription termination/antitermination factor NusG [Bacteroidales bacterium]MBQ2375719.1 transcription termination/antitermination factor NusG [Bacteroidales bacterium]MBQ5872605.1 transcription termination/antitermination factor NusG [Bacteroidales bacterium]MBQ5892158.1 transcription termination/antitermination factor NusG [Bacteroidales bacterium]MED9962304.1 transcription termination/antitermination protein NusG [Bacteroidales bacterium]
MTEELRPKRWYVVKAIAGKEKKAKEYIENEVAHSGFEQYVSQVLIPTEKVFSVRNGKRVSKDRTLFPGYVLIEAALEGEIMHAIRNVPNVIGFLTQKDGTPVPLQEDEVKRILGQVDELIDSEEELMEPFILGETVKIIDGPFNSFSGVIDEINLEKKKLMVIVKIFGRRTPVELSFVQVIK